MHLMVMQPLRGPGRDDGFDVRHWRAAYSPMVFVHNATASRLLATPILRDARVM